MYSYEELLKLGENNKDVGRFCADAVQSHISSKKYKESLDAEQYFKRHNVTIEQFEKWIYTVTGRKIKDIYSANHRIKTHFFYRKVMQHSNYILGNGIKFKNLQTKEKLGKNFEHQMMKLVQYGMICPESYGFWNSDHLEVFSYTCTEDHPGFCAVYSENDGEMKAGIRFYNRKVDDMTFEYLTLYEPDGITLYRRSNKDTDFSVVEEKHRYITSVTYTKAEGLIASETLNYNGLPIIAFSSSDMKESDLSGYREAIDCYDLIKSGLANTIDDASEIYWLVKNAGGMSDLKLAKFLQRLKTVHSASVDSDDSGAGVEAKTIDVPFEARKALLEMIRTDLYDDMMLLDRRNMSAAQKTNQELEMAYQPQDDYINDLEYYVYDFLDRLFELANIDDEAILTRNKIVNKNEQTSMVLSAANFLPDDMVIRHLPFLTPEEAEEAIKGLDKEDLHRFNN